MLEPFELIKEISEQNEELTNLKAKLSEKDKQIEILGIDLHEKIEEILKREYEKITSDIIDLFKELNEFDYEKWDDEDILYKKVFYHELGHLIFEKANTCKCVSKQTKERQANYIASDATNSLIDSYIEDITKLQPVEYHNPLLSFAHFVNKNKKVVRLEPLFYFFMRAPETSSG